MGRSPLSALYGKALPGDALIGESFELSAYEGRESRAADGRSLRELVETHRADLVGAAVWARYGRFPLLIKLLDAQQDCRSKCIPTTSTPSAMGWWTAARWRLGTCCNQTAAA